MKATRKQMIFLGGFMLLVVGFFGTYVYRALAPKGGAARAAEALRPARAERDSGEAKAEEKEGTVSAGEGFSFLASPAAATEYAVIAERKLFEPLIKPQPQPKSPPPSTPPEKIEPAKPVPLPQEETPPAPPSSPNPKVTVTGFLRLPTGGRVIVENLETKETQIVAPGEEAFGYTVAHLDPGRRMALLMRGEERFPVRWGEGKQEVKVAAKPREKKKEEGRGGEQRREEGEERRPGGPPPPPRPASSFQPQPGMPGGPEMRPTFGGFGEGRRPDWRSRFQRRGRPDFSRLSAEERIEMLRRRFGGRIPPEIQRRIDEWRRQRGQ